MLKFIWESVDKHTNEAMDILLARYPNIGIVKQFFIRLVLLLIGFTAGIFGTIVGILKVIFKNDQRR